VARTRCGAIDRPSPRATIVGHHDAVLQTSSAINSQQRPWRDQYLRCTHLQHNKKSQTGLAELAEQQQGRLFTSTRRHGTRGMDQAARASTWVPCYYRARQGQCGQQRQQTGGAQPDLKPLNPFGPGGRQPNGAVLILEVYRRKCWSRHN
jgi:hypothetical protein